MQRFKKYIGKDIRIDRIRDADHILSYELQSHYVPEELGEFEECEFLTDFSGSNLIVCVTVLENKIKRIMFVLSDPADSDTVAPLTESQLMDFLNQKGEKLLSFFEFITS